MRVPTVVGTHALWALDAAAERQELERFVDHVEERLKSHPDLHIYHFGVYEPGTIKRLMGRYATREDEIDRWLICGRHPDTAARAGRFVELHAIVRQALRVGVERPRLGDGRWTLDDPPEVGRVHSLKIASIIL